MKTVCFGLLVLLASFSPVAAGSISPETAKIQRTFSELPKLTKVLAGESRLTLFEGLPHQAWEAELLAKEIAAKKTVKQRNFSFYKKANDVSAKDAAKLRWLCQHRGTFRPYQGPKGCGGFHPDFSLHWTIGKETVELQICFGCDEMRGYLGETYVYCEMTDNGMAWFQKILSRYRLQRPKS